LVKVKPHNAHVVALLRSTKPVVIEGDNLTMEVFYKFHKEKLEEPKIVKMLDEVMEEVMGRNIKLRFVLAERGAVPPKVVARSDVTDISTEDLEKVAAEIFSK